MARSPWEERLRGLKWLHGQPAEPRYKDHHASKQMIFKVTSHIKTKAGVKTVADYISSNGGSSERKAFDENGLELTGDDIAKEIEDWNLVTNSDNLSKKARELSAKARQNLSTKERFRHVQANHMILSFPIGHHDVSDRQLHAITQEFLQPLAEEGHRAIYAIHHHQNNPHVHILVRSQGTRGRLRLAKAQLRTLRSWGASVARDNGLDVYAHARENRRDVVKAIEEGKAPLRNTDSSWRQDQKRKSKQTGRTLLQRQVPTWYERHGLELEARRSSTAKQIDVRPPKIDLPPMPEQASKVIDEQFKAAFEKPDTARQRFLEMLAENRKTAMWYVSHRPDVYGKLTDEATKIKLTDRHLRASDRWRADALRRIDQAQQSVQPADRNKMLVFADLFRNQANTRQAERRSDYERTRLERALDAQGLHSRLPERQDPVKVPEKQLASLKRAIQGVLGRLSVPKPKISLEPQKTPALEPKLEPAQGKPIDAQIQKRTGRLYRDIQHAREPGPGRATPDRVRTRGREK